MRLLVLVVALVAAGCGDDTSSPPVTQDLAASTSGGDMQLYSLCGHPGDTGNSKGVGKYCMDSTMCSGGMATICSTIMPIQQGPTYFCTFPCNPSDPNPCGENASCTCLSQNACGCVPDPCRIGLFG